MHSIRTLIDQQTCHWHVHAQEWSNVTAHGNKCRGSDKLDETVLSSSFSFCDRCPAFGMACPSHSSYATFPSRFSRAPMFVSTVYGSAVRSVLENEHQASVITFKVALKPTSTSICVGKDNRESSTHLQHPKCYYCYYQPKTSNIHTCP